MDVQYHVIWDIRISSHSFILLRLHSPGSLNVKPFLNTLQEYGSIYDSLDDHQILIPGPEVDLPWSPDARDPQSEIPVVDSIIPPLSSIFPLWRNSPGPKRNGWRWGDVESFLKLWIWIFNVNSAKLGQLCYVPQPNLFCKHWQPETVWRKKRLQVCKCNSFNPPQLYWSLMSLIVWSFLASVASNCWEVHTLVGAGSGGDSGGGMDAVSSSRPQKMATKEPRKKYVKLWNCDIQREMPVLSRTDQGKPVETCTGSWRVAVYWSHYTRWVPHVVIKRHFSWSGKLETQGTNWGNSFSSFCTKWLLLSWSIHILEHLKLRWIHVVSHAWQIKIQKKSHLTFHLFSSQVS